MPDHFYVPSLGGWVVLDQGVFFDAETGEALDVDPGLELQDEDGSPTTAGEEAELEADLLDAEADPDEARADADQAYAEMLSEAAEAARAQREASEAYVGAQAEREIDELLQERLAEEQAAEQEEAEAEAEGEARQDFQEARREWERANGYPLTQADAKVLWGEFSAARRHGDPVSFEDVASNLIEHVPNLARDRMARRESLAAHMEEAEQEAELAEAMTDEEPPKIDLGDPKARRRALADAMAEDGAAGISRQEAERMVSERGGRVEKLPHRDGKTGAETFKYIADDAA